MVTFDVFGEPAAGLRRFKIGPLVDRYSRYWTRKS